SGTGYENLLNIRLRSARHAANGITVDRSIAPTQGGESFLTDDPLQHAFAIQARLFFDGKKGHSNRVLAGSRQREAERFALAREKFVRDLNQQAGAVTSLRIAATGAAVGEIDKDLNSLLNDLMAFLAANACHKTDATGVVLVRRVVKTLRRRQTVVCLPVLQNVSFGENRRWSSVARRWPLLSINGLSTNQVQTSSRPIGFCQRPKTNDQRLVFKIARTTTCIYLWYSGLG